VGAFGALAASIVAWGVKVGDHVVALGEGRAGLRPQGKGTTRDGGYGEMA